MSNRKILTDMIENFLSKLPNYNNSIYILEPYEYGDKYISIIYKTWVIEEKLVYSSTKGVYIKGRTANNEGRIYLNDFKNPDGSAYEIKLPENFIKEEKNKISKNKTQFISAKEIVIGGVYQFQNKYDYNYIYLGKCIDKENNNAYHVYKNISKDSNSKYLLANIIHNICTYSYNPLKFVKNKINSIEKIAQFSKYELKAIMNLLKFDDKYELTELNKFLSDLENQNECEHEFQEVKSYFQLRYSKICKKCGKLK